MRAAAPFHEFVAAKLSAVPGAWRDRVTGQYASRVLAAREILPGSGRRSDAERAANVWLADLSDRMRAIRVPLNLSDSELCELARNCASTAMDLAARPGATLAQLRAAMARYVEGYGITPPAEPLRTVDESTGEVRTVRGIEDRGAIRRMSHEQWWRRRLRQAQGRAIEREAIALGYVAKHREIYASNMTVERRRQQKRRNAAAMENTTAVNQAGDEFTLAALAEKSVANPQIRRGELMTRIAGFEAIARGVGHVGVFFTQTCPSRMHPRKITGKSVSDNPKFDGTTPRQAQAYLTKTWAKVRAAWARAGIACYGFRIAEPHHDGAPHWHLLLFVAAECRDELCRIFGKYARAADSEELATNEARAARFKAIDIDPARGSAAGYVAKYVSKNVDGGGYQVQGDIEGSGREAVTPGHRVEAWAAVWGVRQFQQIGGPPVGVWRELRRLKADAERAPIVETARAAADEGDWSRYVEAMGGVFMPRKDRPLALAKTDEGCRWNAAKWVIEQAPLTQYGEPAKGRAYGILDNQTGRPHITRFFEWAIEYKGRAASAGRLGGVGFDVAPLGAPRTRVNNCTEGASANEGQDGGKDAIGSGTGSAGQLAIGTQAREGHSGALRGANARCLADSGACVP